MNSIKSAVVRKIGMWVVALSGLLLFGATTAQAVPSMGRQTGYSCSRCHTVFPELTPFGREFKLSGFAASSSKWDESPFIKRIPVSAVVQVGRTQTSKTNTEDATEENFPRDRKTIVQMAGVYYGGKIIENAGALIQYSYDGIERKWGMEMFDARYANSISIAGKDLAFGVTLNNNPTLSDLYNTTPPWAFPHSESATVMPNASTLVDMTLASQVGGVGVYGLWDGLVYGEVALYRTARRGFFRFMKLGVPSETVLSGRAPYWRLALQKEFMPHSFMVGAYGMNARVVAEPDEPGSGTDRFSDIAVDAMYQYIDNNHVLSAHATSIRERQKWGASFDEGHVSNSSATLRTFRADVHYYFQRRWGGGAQFFRTSGTSDDIRYNNGEAVGGSVNRSPDTRGWVTELNYLPLENIKLALRYTAFEKFNGASRNYDGFGRNARDNNSIFLMAWTVF